MISHQHRCIFIHIPRTAGTSIEDWLSPDPQWRASPEEKHLTSIQARRLYRVYWDDYFKFTFVRSPYTRSASLLSRYSSFYGVGIKKGAIHFGKYKARFGSPMTLEHDLRFYRYNELLELDSFCERPYRPHSVYGNILTESLDKVYRFEDLQDAVVDIAERLRLPAPRLAHRVAALKALDPGILQSSRSIQRVNKLYANDFEVYGYERILP
ncbi:conserved protein of unknown function [Cyanobium sp. NIES-981]|nr:conserved protein of unknown function [Cyanobium sp. NIES-981]